MRPAKRDCPPPQWATPADRLVWNLDNSNGDDRRFRRRIFAQWPERIALAVAHKYRDTWENKNQRAANLYLLGLEERFTRSNLKLAWRDDELVAETEKARTRCSERMNLYSGKPDALINGLIQIARNYGLNIQEVEIKGEHRIKVGQTTYCVDGFIQRVTDPDCRWWRRQLRSQHGRDFEKAAIEIGLVRVQMGNYVSNETLARKRTQHKRNRRMLESMQAINENGDCLSLVEISDLTVSNPRIRRAELMVRVRGFEEIAKEIGHVAEFYTLTCPSRMHAWLAEAGKPNPKYDGTDPRSAQEYLRHIWALIRSTADRKGLEFYGFRVAEPQHDGTPHWHLLLFMPADQVAHVREVFKHYALRMDGDEPGADKHRFKAVAIDWDRGSAAGYIAKYISKSIDGHGLDSGVYGEEPKEAAQRVVAHASTWGMRQFQQVGGPPVTVYRELRRLRGKGPQDRLGELSEAADQGDWKSYVRLMGGPLSPRKDRALRLGKVWSDEPGRYGEPLGWQIKGVQMKNLFIPTRIHTWRIERRPIGTAPNTTVPNNRTAPVEKIKNGVLLDFERTQETQKGEPGEVKDGRSPAERTLDADRLAPSLQGTRQNLSFEACPPSSPGGEGFPALGRG